MIKDELGGKIVRKLLRLTANTYSYLIGKGSQDEKTKDKKIVS